ncbi:MAG: hypothetical protein A3A33_02385 [Candidatus Yanofskybacteria bacterium RIFCSPLOWO2_01_FULL_49_25]|uniref:Uncharacterized protein n=1 Tax=Candidatus Yanofskybacteria bacterium RIFCSPLOWO2_01_FULL_49_25 TaxID=1802701 RepID=A0A1F8GT77_9BACT|nr:MAG: hypothetical protein A3A33_02385 [Candidatus Yanofskybacteria bacterium RIFCSPLOWO2_01_FULL_49_25]
MGDKEQLDLFKKPESTEAVDRPVSTRSIEVKPPKCEKCNDLGDWCDCPRAKALKQKENERRYPN